MSEINLASVKFGHEYPGSSINVRVHERDTDQKPLMASIKQEGLLQPMLVMKNGAGFYVVDGNRRLAALHKLGVKKIPESWLHVVDVESPDSAIAKGLAANIQRVPLHEVDRFEAFSAINLPTADIARMFGVSEIMIRRSLVLGKLAPEIRKMWREGKIEPSAAIAFTVEPDQKRQVETMTRLKKQHNLYAHNVKRALVGDQFHAGSLLKFVGKDRYIKEGGAIGEDLFADREDDQTHVSDIKKLEDMARLQVHGTLEKLRGQGWAWAEYAADLPDQWKYSWERRDAKGDKSKLGVVVEIVNGEAEIISGVVKPGTKLQAEKREEKKKKSPADVSQALSRRIEEQGAKALQDALTTIKHDSDTDAILAKACAAMIVPHAPYQTPRQLAEKMDAIRDSIMPLTMQSALIKRFDRKDYFTNAPKALVLKAITESCGADAAKAVSTKKTRADLAKFALANVPKTWLPPQIRNKGYKSARPK